MVLTLHTKNSRIVLFASFLPSSYVLASFSSTQILDKSRDNRGYAKGIARNLFTTHSGVITTIVHRRNVSLEKQPLSTESSWRADKVLQILSSDKTSMFYEDWAYSPRVVVCISFSQLSRLVPEDMGRFLGYRTRQKYLFSFCHRKSQNRILKPAFLSSLKSIVREKGLFRRIRSILAFGLWLVIISGCYRYQPFSHLIGPSNHTGKCSSTSCSQEQETTNANRRCSSSKTFVGVSKHPLASLRCLNASRSGFREGLDCAISTRKPTLLWTIPGAGNTWVRNLLEQATGVATGSVYNDSSLFKVFVGEGFCDDTTLCIKAHPSTHPFELLSDQGEDFQLSSPMLSFRNSVTKSASDALRRNIMFRSHCRPRWDSQRSGKSIEFRRAVIIDRNPLEAAFAEVQRLTFNRQGREKGSHVNRIPRTFKQDVNNRVWNRLCADYLRLGSDYVLAWHSYVQFLQRFGKEAVYLARYEDLKDREKRNEILRDMVIFLDAELLTGSSECAFARSKDSRIRRGYGKGSKTRSETKDLGSSSHMTLSEFLNSDFMGKPLIERMWKIVGKIAEARGYEAPKDFRLSNYRQSNGTEDDRDVDRAIGFPTNRWYYEKGKMAILRALEPGSRVNGTFRQEVGGQKRVISSEYFPCVKKASLSQRNGHVLLMFAGNPVGVGINDRRSVFPVLLNSILWMRAVGVRELLVVCFDEEYEYILRSLGVNTCYLELQSGRSSKPPGYDRDRVVTSEIYEQRLAVIEAMLRAEIDVIHTDTDAVWTGDPFAVFRSYDESDKARSDIVASRGTFPYKESMSWGGSTLCMGLISFRATPGVRQVLRTARLTSHKYHGDDQIGLNRGLAQLGIIWFDKEQELGEIVLPSASSISRIRVRLLSDSTVRRNCTSNDSAYALIMHCFDRRSTSLAKADTKDLMMERGLWLLKQNWLEMLISRENANRSIEVLRVHR